MSDGKDTTVITMSFLEKAKLQAQNEAQKERFDAAKDKLLSLYRKRDAAQKIVKNIENEITDYEMELSKEG